MLDLVGIGGGAEDWRKAARDVVAAYLNSSFGMNYPVEPDTIADYWYDAVHGGISFHDLHIMLGTWNDELECPL